MRHLTMVSICCLAVLALFAPVPPAWAEEAAPPDATEVRLLQEPAPAGAALFTPVRIMTNGGRMFGVNNAPETTVPVAGQKVKIAGRYDGKNRGFGIDINGDGVLDEKEWMPLNSSTKSVPAVLKVGGRDYPVRLDDAAVYVRGNQVTDVLVRISSSLCFRGKYNKLDIRLVDDNLDGKFTQDGQDAIFIGEAAAQPLGKMHWLGNAWCELVVQPDGSSLSVRTLPDPPVGQVETSFKNGLRTLVLLDKDGKVVDVAARNAIPEGEYRLVYGILSASGKTATFGPTKEALTYPIQAGQINTLRLGLPLHVNFFASYQGDVVTVQPKVVVLGAGNELYNLAFAGEVGRPHVVLMNGNTKLLDKAMDYG